MKMMGSAARLLMRSGGAWLLLISTAVASNAVTSTESTEASTGTTHRSLDAATARHLQGDSTTTTTCPDYREFDFDHPTTPIFGAPDGCRCWEGLSELHCSYCEDDTPCQQYNMSHGCRKGFRHSENDQRIAYKCRLVDDKLFYNGKVSFYYDLQHGTANITVFNTRNMDSFHLMDCNLSQCKFDRRGGAGTSCQVADCICSDQCDDFTKETVQRLSSDSSVTAVIDVDDPTTTGGESNVDILIGEQFVIETKCTASTCTPDIDPDWESYSSKSKDATSDATTTTTAAAAGKMTMGVLLLLSVLLPPALKW